MRLPSRGKILIFAGAAIGAAVAFRWGLTRVRRERQRCDVLKAAEVCKGKIDVRELEAMGKSWYEQFPCGSCHGSQFFGILCRELELQDGLNDKFSASLKVFLSHFLDLLDTAGDGWLSFSEVAYEIAVLTRGSALEKLDQTFRLFDTDNSGNLSKEEVCRAVQFVHVAMGEEAGPMDEDLVAAQWFLRADADGSGSVDLQEFVAAVLASPLFNRKVALDDAVSLFNHKPSRGHAHLLCSLHRVAGEQASEEALLLPSCSGPRAPALVKQRSRGMEMVSAAIVSRASTEPHNIAATLHALVQVGQISLVAVGEYLGGPEEAEVLGSFVGLIDLGQLELDLALRKFVQFTCFPCEGQKVDRFLEAFSCAYHRDNPNALPDCSVAYLLAVALVMLSTDAHNEAVKVKMTKQQFVRLVSREAPSMPVPTIAAMHDRVVAEKLSVCPQSATSSPLRSRSSSTTEIKEEESFHERSMFKILADALMGVLSTVNDGARAPPTESGNCRSRRGSSTSKPGRSSIFQAG